ncbi:MAG: hypothetical protein LBG24_01995 [Treponema sp.]|jgi:hypothetical protein|nr:hypothetical protein [Treponema sp.]
MKHFIILLCMVLYAMNVFAGGQAESGRSASYGAAETGQFTESSQVDVPSAINDYSFPYTVNNDEDISVFVKLEKNALPVMEERITDANLNLLIGLQVNNKDFFTRNEGNYIIFIQNQALLQKDDWRTALISVVTHIRQAQKTNAVLGVFSPQDNSVIEIPTAASIPGILSQIQNSRRTNYTTGSLFDKVIQAEEKIDNGYATRFVWISDSDPLKDSSEIEIFNFFSELGAQNHISFSYLIYNEPPDLSGLNARRVLKKERIRYRDMPNWAVINDALIRFGGDSCFVQTVHELEKTLLSDYERFVYPAVENIKVYMTLKPWVRFHGYNYGIYSEIKSMDYDEHRMFLYNLNIQPAYSPADIRHGNQSVESVQIDPFREAFENGIIPVGICTVEYYSFNAKEIIYKTYPMQVSITEDHREYLKSIDETVSKYTVLQNTSTILANLSVFSNRKDIPALSYYRTILMVNSQIQKLQEYHYKKDDPIIAEDIETLKQNRDVLMGQARSLHYIK